MSRFPMPRYPNGWFQVAYSDELDHELELAAVIGRTVKDVAPQDAPGCIFGYTIWNDFSGSP